MPASKQHHRTQIEALASEIREHRAILFVGAGVSAGLGLPSWCDLIERLGAELGFEADAFFDLSNDFRSLTEYYRLEKARSTTYATGWSANGKSMTRL